MSLRWPLGIQLALPDGFEADHEFASLLDALREEGFQELELAVSDIDRLSPGTLRRFLSAHGFSLTRLATGAAARRYGLSLSALDESVRTRSVVKCAAMIQYAGQFPAELIIGILKGVPGPGDRGAGERLRRSMEDLARMVGRSPVPVLLEVTHRGECPVITTPEEAAAAIAPYPEFGYRVLLDTYHLHHEGLAVPDALAAASDIRGSIHLSDDNRRLPGPGRMDFAPILRALESRGYAGSLVLEGTLGPDPRDDIRQSADHLRGLAVR